MNEKAVSRREVCRGLFAGGLAAGSAGRFAASASPERLTLSVRM